MNHSDKHPRSGSAPRRGMLTLLLGASTALAALGLFHSEQGRAETAIDWQGYNTQVRERQILPGYSAFAAASRTLTERTEQLCQRPGDDASLAAAQQAFREMLHAWEGISHIQFGPIQTLMRNYAIQYWPDRKNIGQRQLAVALQTPGATAFDPEFFRQASISIKGIPALERLLFDPHALERIAREPRYCELTSAVADYLSLTADDLLQEWQQMPIAATTASDEDDDSEGNLPQFSLDLMKSLVEPIEAIRDTKLLAVLGHSYQQTRPMRAESWRSGQSIANLRANIAAAYALYLGGSTQPDAGLAAILQAHGGGDLDAEIQRLFHEVQATLAQQPDALTSALDTLEGYNTLLILTNSLKDLEQALSSAMQLLDIQLGFNSRDGD